jgi:hypothetical protein
LPATTKPRLALLKAYVNDASTLLEHEEAPYPKTVNTSSTAVVFYAAHMTAQGATPTF